mgnify:CR=1 FL=1
MRAPPAASSSLAAATRLTDLSIVCRYLAAQCQVRLGKWDDALEMVGRGGILGTAIGADDEPGDGGIKVRLRSSVERWGGQATDVVWVQIAASTAHLRGLIHLHMGATDLAKDSFVEALSRDVKCFESFEMLVGSEMMSSDEGPSFHPLVALQMIADPRFAEWEFIQGLRYQALTGEDADFVRMMYTVRLKKARLCLFLPAFHMLTEVI